MLVPGALLVVACVLVGVLPGQTIGPLLATAGAAILGDVPQYELAVWHGFTPALLMSLVALAGGVTFYSLLYRKNQTLAATPFLSRVDSKRMFDIANVAVTRTAGRAARWLFARRLQPQLLLIVASACMAVALPLSTGGWLVHDLNVAPLDPVFAALWIVGGACAIGAAWQAKFHRLAALVMVGEPAVVCLTFAWLSAPDLALTQIAVEVVTMVLFLLGLRWMPRRLVLGEGAAAQRPCRARRARDAVLAAVAGIGLGLLAFAVLLRLPGCWRLLLRQRARSGRRTQRRESDPRQLSRLRHARRDHGRRQRSRHRLRAAATVPAGAGEHRRAARTTSRGRERRSRGNAERPPPEQPHARAGRARAPAVPDGGARLVLFSAARP
jgi:multicomponent K+:H+ antiporter subunit A